MLLPAAVLVMVVLAALVVDSAGVWLGQRELQTTAMTAATDAVSALSQADYYRTGEVRLDPAEATATALTTVDSASWSGVELSGPPTVVVAGRQVCVRLSGVVRPVLGSGLPGLGAGTVVHARAAATIAGDVPTGVTKGLSC